MTFSGGSEYTNISTFSFGNGYSGYDFKAYSAEFHTGPLPTYLEGGMCPFEGIHLRSFGLLDGWFKVDQTMMTDRFYGQDDPTMVKPGKEVDRVTYNTPRWNPARFLANN